MTLIEARYYAERQGEKTKQSQLVYRYDGKYNVTSGTLPLHGTSVGRYYPSSYTSPGWDGAQKNPKIFKAHVMRKKRNSIDSIDSREFAVEYLLQAGHDVCEIAVLPDEELIELAQECLVEGGSVENPRSRYTRRRRNTEGFKTPDGVFHPIRAGVGYGAGAAGDYVTRPKKKAVKKKAVKKTARKKVASRKVVGKKKSTGVCVCSDPGCPVHEGRSSCSHKASVTVKRSDYGQTDRFRMCEGCANDALSSGVFY